MPATSPQLAGARKLNVSILAGPLCVAVIFWASWLGWIPLQFAVPLCTMAGFMAGALSHRLPRRRRRCEACALMHHWEAATHVLSNGRYMCEHHARTAPTWSSVVVIQRECR